jgi:two-component system sensor histidine kinase FlrB
MNSTRTATEPTFDAFDRLSSELTQAYRALVGRTEALERQLQASRREKERLADRLGALLDSLPAAIIVLGRDGLVREANATAFEWLGAEDDARGFWTRVCREFGGPERSEESGDADAELEIDGRLLTVSRRAVPARGEIVLVLADVTEQRRLQQEVEQNRRLATMGEMAARLAHQLRTPLSTGMLYAGHLADADLDDERRGRFAQRVLARLRDLDRMTRDMLGFVRGAVQAGERFEAQALFEDVAAALEPRIEGERTLELVAGQAAGCWLEGDRDALRGALCNLVENAWGAGAGRVGVEFVAADAGGDALVLRVHDDGPGIAPALRERVFEPFFSTRLGGTGLGLPVARSVVDSHGGSLEIADAGNGAGACFELRLPLAPIESPAAEARQ